MNEPPHIRRELRRRFACAASVFAACFIAMFMCHWWGVTVVVLMAAAAVFGREDAS